MPRLDSCGQERIEQTMRMILIVEDNITLSQMQRAWLESSGYKVVTAIDEPSARGWLKKESFDLVFLDVCLPKGNGISLLEWMNKTGIDIPFIVMTERASYPDAVRAIKLGAKDYLPKPIYRDQLLELARMWIDIPMHVPSENVPLLRRTSPAARLAEKLARRVAPSEMSVLILGANGTGKESIAQLIHRESLRHSCPFVAVNCGTLSREMARSDFFGHVKGAFTGAVADRKGYFEMAKGGTLFLDEIGTMEFDVQAMLLRVLQEGTYMPVGGTREKKADVRVIAATNEDLSKAIREGRFREDLYHRLAEFEIRQPSLSECKEDILPLARFFISRYSKELKREISGITKDAEEALLAYAWSGNVRELQRRVKRAVLMAESDQLEVTDFDLPLIQPTTDLPSHLDFKLKYKSSGKPDEDEKRRIVKVLSETGGNLAKTAQILGISRPTLNRRLKKYRLK